MQLIVRDLQYVRRIYARSRNSSSRDESFQKEWKNTTMPSTWTLETLVRTTLEAEFLEALAWNTKRPSYSTVQYLRTSIIKALQSLYSRRFTSGLPKLDGLDLDRSLICYWRWRPARVFRPFRNNSQFCYSSQANNRNDTSPS